LAEDQSSGSCKRLGRPEVAESPSGTSSLFVERVEREQGRCGPMTTFIDTTNHEITNEGEESLATMAFTALFEREAAEYGVPLAIIGKLVQTEPGQMALNIPSTMMQSSIMKH
jgi:hypothetical protein